MYRQLRMFSGGIPKMLGHSLGVGAAFVIPSLMPFRRRWRSLGVVLVVAVALLVSAPPEMTSGWLWATLRSASPILFVVVGETLTQLTGVINLGVEGQMLLGACVGFAVTVISQNPWLGLLAGSLAGLALSSLHMLLCVGLRTNAIASGVAVWVLGSGLSAYWGRAYVGQKISGLGAVVGELTPTILLSLLLVPVIGVLVYGTHTGLIWRAVGESIPASRSMGIRPWWVQMQGIGIGGLLSGLGGAALSVDYTLTWAENMTAGRGLVAVGLVIVARWNPFWACPAALLFGGSEALYLRLQSMGVEVSSYLLATLPYLLSLAVLVVSSATAQRGGMPQGLKGVFGSTG
ncbi:MAG: ABC transporter permease [Cyanobacteriota bacterium]|nr:ABC transporter permease [Cyanobacteriota bacterium]